MKRSVLFIMLAVFFLMNGCGSSHTNDGKDQYVQEVNGPAGDFAGATEFEPAMLVDWQTIYTYDEKDSMWIGVVFSPHGDLIYESINGIEKGATYSIDDGKLVITDNIKNPTISLNSAEPTLWKVTGMDDDGRIWQDTWYLELKFKPEMIVGKCYLSKYNNEGKDVSEKICFSETTHTVYAMDGTLKHEYPYKLENNALIVSSDEGDYTLYLMSINDNNQLNIWYASEIDNYANNSSWTAIQ